MRSFVALAGGFVLLFSLLFLSLGPAVEVQKRPSATDVQAASQIWRQLLFARGMGPTEIYLDSAMMSGLSALARDAAKIERVDAAFLRGELRTQASIRLPLGLWLNVSAATRGKHSGFPAYEVKVGRVTFPAAMGRLLAAIARSFFRMRGASIPPLDEVVQSFSIDGQHAVAKVHLPSSMGVIDGLMAAQSADVSREQVENAFCRIAALEQEKPAKTLSELVQRSFAPPVVGRVDQANRASFIALSLAVVGGQANSLIPRAAEIRTKCSFPEREVVLHGRADLAKHWIFSAGLTSALGEQPADYLGEWKELQDSAFGGSGFSFVDLAADRAGVRTALGAVDARTASATRRRLGGATDEVLMPTVLLEGIEGISDASFKRQFGSIEDDEYREAASRIDRILLRHDAGA